MVSIARKTLFHDFIPFAIAQAGIAFSVGLVTVQVGLFYGFTRSTSLIVDRAKADIWVVSSKLQQLDLTLPIPYGRLAEAKKVPGVDRAEAFIFQGVVWQQSTQPIAPATVIGFERNSQFFALNPLLDGRLDAIWHPYAAVLNRSDARFLNIAKVGDGAKIGDRRVEVIGFTSGLRSMVSDPFLFTSLENGAAFVKASAQPELAQTKDLPQLSDADGITAVLVRARAGQNLPQLQKRLKAALPDTQVYTQAELSTLTQIYWLNNTGVTFVLGLGAVVAIAVGTVIVSQVLYASVARHLSEYATLKAMGASRTVLYRIILEQALWMALLGYIPGIGMSMGLGVWTQQTQAIQILVTPVSAAAVFGLTLVMCSGSAIFAIQKAIALDPALVFKPE
ncbi:ABC transporter permease [Altericista sp. CCNU0014]|uniref:ABC transporter permease n=1 Tax=Altericista sp. CCNU0014 TaxID=3082949 RepID=UPI0038515F22